ncbi:MAG: DciA family protein [Pseudomonadota bacterium]
MPPKSTPKPDTPRRVRKFTQASALVSRHVRKAGEDRGFAVSRLLTHWADIVGADLAAGTRPVKVAYGRKGFGATLTVLTTGARAPMLQAELPKLKDRVNACYGYAAISHIKLTQTAPTGFAEGQATFEGAPLKPDLEPDPGVLADAQRATAGVSDTGLRDALETLGAHILGKPKT